MNDFLQKRWKTPEAFALISSQTSLDVLYHKPAFLWALETVFISIISLNIQMDTGLNK